ncbi:MAG: PadR family transcriptional regulator [Chloroflexota bacterium]
MNKKKINKYLPLTESSAYILLALTEPLHGYGVMQKVASLSKETVTIGAGTLYTAFSTLEKQKLIAKAGQEGRRKLYVLTELGRHVLAEHIKITAILVENARSLGISKE